VLPEIRLHPYGISGIVPSIMKCSPFIRPLLRSLGIGVLLFYFGFHLLHGDQGLIGRAIHQHKQKKLHAEIAKVRGERERIERDISLIRGPEIDADLLGELARKQLPMAGANEIIIVR
jgi:cell division protein FtsB